MLTFPKDLEFSGLIDDGLDTQYQPQFVVHFEPVVFHRVFDAGPRLTLGTVTRLHFAVETFVPFTTEVGEYFPGREGQQGEGQQPLKQAGQGVLANKAKVRGELDLIANPVVTA